MKQPPSNAQNRNWRPCPVGCPVCHYDGDVYPVRFTNYDLNTDDTFRNIMGNFNHILFLLDGKVQVTFGKKVISLNSRQCMFIPRNKIPEVKALQPSKGVWLDFSNRIMLGRQDCLARIASHSCKDRSDRPALELNDMIITTLSNMSMIDSPCYHLLRQYDLFFLMVSSYPPAALACFFKPILKASDDFRAFVEHNYTYKDSLHDVAGKANLSPICFMRRFKEVFDITPHQWLVKQKRQELVRMIASGQVNTKVLSDRLGFKDQAGLYQFCRTSFKCSITELISRI